MHRRSTHVVPLVAIRGPVDAGVGGHVGLVDGHRGQAFPAGGGGGRAEDEGAREVDQFGAVGDERAVQVPDRQADPEAAVTGQRHGGHPHHRPRERAGPAGRVPGRRRGDDHRLVPTQDQVLGHPQRAMRDTVHIRRERFGNDHYSHAHNVNHEMPQQDMTQLCVEELWATFCHHPHLRLRIRLSGAFPVTGVSAHSHRFPGYVFPRATVTPNSCEAPVTGNRPDGARDGARSRDPACRGFGHDHVRCVPIPAAKIRDMPDGRGPRLAVRRSRARRAGGGAAEEDGALARVAGQ